MRRSPAALARLGLRDGEAARFRRGDRGRPVVGRVVGIEDDGSIALRDPDGSARSLRPERVEIRRPGSRGRLRWQVVSDVAVTWEQLELFEAAPDPDGAPGPHVTIRRRQPTLFDDADRGRSDGSGSTPDPTPSVGDDDRRPPVVRTRRARR